jgi:hypothetical protein
MSKFRYTHTGILRRRERFGRSAYPARSTDLRQTKLYWITESPFSRKYRKEDGTPTKDDYLCYKLDLDSIKPIKEK